MGFVSERHADELARLRAEAAGCAAKAEILEQENRRLAGMVDALSLEVQRLTNHLIQMKREGYHPAAVMLDAPPEPVEELHPDIVRAIDSIARDDRRLRQALVEDAIRMRDQEEMPVNQIIATTLRGGAYSGGEQWDAEESHGM